MTHPNGNLPPSSSWDLLLSKIRALPRRQELVMALRFEAGMVNVTTIAATLSQAEPDAVPPWTEHEVEVTYNQALDALRDMLADDSAWMDPKHL